MDKQKVTPEELVDHCESTIGRTLLFGAGLAGSISLLSVDIIDRYAFVSDLVCAFIILSAAAISFSRNYHERVVQVIRRSLKKDSICLEKLEECLLLAQRGNISLDIAALLMIFIGLSFLLEISIKLSLEFYKYSMGAGLDSCDASVAFIVILIIFLIAIWCLFRKVCKLNPPYHLEIKRRDNRIDL